MSQQQDFQPRIGIAANRIVSATLFGIAITTYAVRTYIRARLMKRFLADDYLLLFAVICLIAGTGLDFANKQHEYDLFVAVLNDPDSVLLLSLLPSIPTIFKEEDAVQTIWWFVIFPVKLAFLFFFRRLVHRLRNLKIWWYCITTFTVLAGLTCVAVTWLSCPYFSLAGIISCSGPAATNRVIYSTSITTAMDVSTDILLITLPTTLLWRVNIARRQKLGLALSLCLSLVISSMAVIKMAGGVTGSGGGGGVDIVWIAFWQQQEASIAVIVISVSAFRSFFVGGTRTSAADRGEGGRGGQRVLKSWPRTRTRTRSGGEGLTAHGEENGLVETESGYELPRMPMAYMVGVRSEDWGREGARPGERESGGRRGVVESEESLLEP